MCLNAIFSVLHMHREICMNTFIDKFTSPVPIQKDTCVYTYQSKVILFAGG